MIVRLGDPGDDPADSDVPPPGDQDAPRDDDPWPGGGPARAGYSDADQDDDGWLAPDWPDLPAAIPPAFTRPGPGSPTASLSPACSMSRCPGRCWPGSAPGRATWAGIGPITAAQARRLAAAAARDPGTEWRIIVATTSGHALTVTRIPRPRGRSPGNGAGQEPGAGAGTGGAAGLVPG